MLHVGQTPGPDQDWDRSALEKYFQAKHDWTPEMTAENIFRVVKGQQQKLRESDVNYDKTSVMVYPFPGEVFNSGRDTVCASKLSAKDKQEIRDTYPPVSRSSADATTIALRPNIRPPGSEASPSPGNPVPETASCRLTTM